MKLLGPQVEEEKKDSSQSGGYFEGDDELRA